MGWCVAFLLGTTGRAPSSPSRHPADRRWASASRRGCSRRRSGRRRGGRRWQSCSLAISSLLPGFFALLLYGCLGAILCRRIVKGCDARMSRTTKR